MIRYIKILVFLACLAPLGLLLWRFFGRTPFDMTTWGAGLGANPLEHITHATGNWTLRFLLITLTITPARKLFHVPSLIRFRRMLGLYAFFYASLHLMTYVWFDKEFVVHDMLVDIAKRKFITVGLLAFTLLVPLAVTSTTGWIRRLGGKRWQLLHRLIYIAAISGVIHYIWLVKKDTRIPLEYGAWLTVLLGYRAVVWALPRIRKARAVPVVRRPPAMAE